MTQLGDSSDAHLASISLNGSEYIQEYKAQQQLDENFDLKVIRNWMEGNAKYYSVEIQQFLEGKYLNQAPIAEMFGVTISAISKKKGSKTITPPQFWRIRYEHTEYISDLIQSKQDQQNGIDFGFINALKFTRSHLSNRLNSALLKPLSLYEFKLLCKTLSSGEWSIALEEGNLSMLRDTAVEIDRSLEEEYQSNRAYFTTVDADEDLLSVLKRLIQKWAIPFVITIDSLKN